MLEQINIGSNSFVYHKHWETFAMIPEQVWETVRAFMFYHFCSCATLGAIVYRLSRLSPSFR